MNTDDDFLTPKALQTLASELIEHDPKGEHVSIWIEQWTDEEIQRCKLHPTFVPERFR